MVLVKIDKIKLKKNFDTLYRNRNEIYFRTVAWINDDYSTAQFYPPKEFHKDNNPFSAPIIKILKDQELPIDTVVFTNKHPNLKESLFEFYIERSKLGILKRNVKILILKLENKNILCYKEEEGLRDKIFALKRDFLNIEGASLSILNSQDPPPNDKLKLYWDEIRKIEKLLKDMKYFPNDSIILLQNKIAEIEVDMKKAQRNLHVLAKKILSYEKEPKINFMMQFMESDVDMRKAGDFLLNANTMFKSIKTSVFSDLDVRFDAYVADLKMDEQRQLGLEEELIFEEKAYISDVLPWKTGIGIVDAAITLTGNLLKLNKDDEVAFINGTIIGSQVKDFDSIEIKNSSDDNPIEVVDSTSIINHKNILITLKIVPNNKFKAILDPKNQLFKPILDYSESNSIHDILSDLRTEVKDILEKDPNKRAVMGQIRVEVEEEEKIKIDSTILNNIF